MRIVNRETGGVIPDVARMDTPLKRFMGLRFREPGRAFFTLPRPARVRIDMLFVRGPIDIAFLDAEKTVQEIHGAHPVTTRPATWRTYRPNEPVSYVLEVERGLLAEHGFAPGHTVTAHD